MFLTVTENVQDTHTHTHLCEAQFNSPLFEGSCELLELLQIAGLLGVSCHCGHGAHGRDWGGGGAYSALHTLLPLQWPQPVVKMMLQHRLGKHTTFSNTGMLRDRQRFHFKHIAKILFIFPQGSFLPLWFWTVQSFKVTNLGLR